MFELYCVGKDFYQKVKLAQEPLVTDTEKAAGEIKAWHSYSPYSLSAKHGRSLQLLEYEGEIRKDPKYPGIAYSSRSIKGYPIKEPTVMFWSSAQHQLQVKGLLDHYSLDRVDIASDYMRTNGLETERVVRKAKVEKVIYKGKYIPIDDWRRLMIENPPVINNSDKPGEVVSPEVIKAYLREAEFFTTMRDMQLGERIIDLISASKVIEEGAGFLDGDRTIKLVKDGKNLESVKKALAKFNGDSPYLKRQLELVKNLHELFPNRKKGIINPGLAFFTITERALEWHNKRNLSGLQEVVDNKRLQKTYMRFLAPHTIRDIQTFLSQVAPAKMGEYLAIFHSLGLRHGYATSHNWTLASTLVDLDSVGGAVIGDKETTESQRTEDISSTLDSLISIAQIKKTEVRLPDHDKQSYRGFISQIMDTRKMVGWMNTLFLSGYIVEAARRKNMLAALDKALENEETVDLVLLQDICPFLKDEQHTIYQNPVITSSIMITAKGMRQVEKETEK